MTHRFTAPLSTNAEGLPTLSDGYRLIELVETYWYVKGRPLRLDDWQKHLLIRVLERREDTGALRYRQVVVSIPRQAGKSLLAAVLSLYGLLQHCHAPKVLGVARSVQQANVVYGYTADAIRQSDALSDVLSPTGTRGISQVDGLGTYKVLPAKPEGVQGYESTLSICDELHVMRPEIWNAIVESQTAQDEPLLVGITTAGDVTSVLLKSLYERGDAAIAGGDETFGFFVYESDSDELSIESLTEANPAIACGRIDAATILADCKGQPRAQWMRYRLNRFVEGVSEPWVPVEAWSKCAGTGLDDFRDCIYAIDVTSTWSYATITASKNIDGVVHTSLVARLVKPNVDSLKTWVDRLKKAGRCQFVMDPARLRTLVEYLDTKGKEPMRIYGGRKAEAAGLVYAAVLQGKVRHDNAGLVNRQHSLAKTKSAGTEFIIVPNEADADACYASVYGIYASLTMRKKELQIA